MSDLSLNHLFQHQIEDKEAVVHKWKCTHQPPSQHEQIKRWNHVLSMWCTLRTAHLPANQNKTKASTVATSHSCGIPRFLLSRPRARFLSEIQSGLNSTLLILSKNYAGVKQDLYESLTHDKGEGLAKWPAVPNEHLGTKFCYQNNCLKCPF